MVEPVSGIVISLNALRNRPAMAIGLHRGAAQCFSTTTIASSITSPTAAANPAQRHQVKNLAQQFEDDERHHHGDRITRPATIDVLQSPRNADQNDRSEYQTQQNRVSHTG